MVILRIWLPSRKIPGSKGFSSIDVDSPSGSTYMSVRPVDPGKDRLLKTPTATLADDIEAEGGDTPHLWRFRNLDEARMMRVWDQFKGLGAAKWKNDATENCFHFCDMVLAAGQGVDVEAFSGASLTNRAKGALHLATLAFSHTTLAARAEDYLKVRHC